MFLQARKILLAQLTKEQQAIGIRYANEVFGHTTEHEILHSDCSHDAAPSATAAPSDIVKRIVEGGATRILFKADGYCPSCGHNRNISSVSSIYMGEGKHACQLCGTGWLEIKRRDMKGEPVECGYDRTASLNAGHYVCLCGGACSSPTTREQP